jgi:hypothetical protein
MPLEAFLTMGWPELPTSDPSAASAIYKVFCESANSQKDAYSESFHDILSGLRASVTNEEPVYIKSTDALFRRRAGGFSDIKNFIGKLSEIVATSSNIGRVNCEIDVFAYAFLKGAKNFDFFLPESKNDIGPFRKIHPQWQKELTALETYISHDRKTIF